MVCRWPQSQEGDWAICASLHDTGVSDYARLLALCPAVVVVVECIYEPYVFSQWLRHRTGADLGGD